MIEPGPPDPVPPSASDVAWRAICLAAHIMRGQLEKSLAEDGPDASDVPEYAETLHRFIAEARLTEWFSPVEAAAAGIPVGRWTQQQTINAIWRFEAAAVLLWSLSRLELPPYDTTIQPEALSRVVPLLAPPQHVARFVDTAQLRERVEILDAAELAMDWHWRARTHGLATGYIGSSHDADFDAYARRAALRLGEQGAFEPIDEDFPVFGTAYRDATEDEYHHLTSIASERHYAFNWLCNCSPGWDNISTDT